MTDLIDLSHPVEDGMVTSPGLVDEGSRLVGIDAVNVDDTTGVRSAHGSARSPLWMSIRACAVRSDHEVGTSPARR